MSKKTAEQKPKKRHTLRNIILLVILALILVLVIVIVCFSTKNSKQMNLAADQAFSAVDSKFTLTEKDCSDFEDLKIYGFVDFDTKQYDMDGVGNLCVMRASGGPMQMLTFVITPIKKDLPLFSVDYMYVLGNRTAYVEIYDMPIGETDSHTAAIQHLKDVAGKYTELTDADTAASWHDEYLKAGSFKKTKPADDAVILDMLSDYMDVFLDECKTMEDIPEDQIPAKIDAMEEYTHRLLSDGGISTDTFKKEIGEERTRELFDKVMFGTENYRK